MRGKESHRHIQMRRGSTQRPGPTDMQKSDSGALGMAVTRMVDKSIMDFFFFFWETVMEGELVRARAFRAPMQDGARSGHFTGIGT